MVNASRAFIQALYDDQRAYLEKIDMTLKSGAVLHLTNEDIWGGSLSIEDSVGSDGSFTALGACVINSLKFTLNNIYDDFSEYDFMDAVASVQIGLEIGSTPEYLKKGVFTVVDPVYNGSTIALTLYDNMHKFDVPYTESSLTYPASLDTIVRDLCTTCGVTLATSSYNFPQKSFVIPTRPDDDAVTCREVLSWCATIAGCFARCNVDGELDLKWFDTAAFDETADDIDGGIFDNYGQQSYTTGDDVDGGEFNPWNTGDEAEGGSFAWNDVHLIPSLYSQNISVDDVVITQVNAEVKVQEEGSGGESIVTYTEGQAGYAIKILPNPFITTLNAQTIVSYLGNQVIGLTFRKASVTHSSNPSIEAGDCAFIFDRKNNRYQILITRTNFVVGSAQTTVCGADTPERNSATRFTETTKSYVELRKRLLEQKNAWEQAEEDLSERINNASGLYETDVEQADHSVIHYLHDKPELEDSDILIMVSSVGVTVSPDGGTTWYGLTVNGQLIASILNTVGINADWINTGQLVVKDANQNETLFVDVDTGTVRINASQLSINSQTVNSMIDEASGLTLQTPYTWSNNNQTANFSAIVYRGKEDITSDCDASWFEWYLRKEGSETRIAVGKTVSVNKSNLGYGGTVVCKFTYYDQTAPLQTRSGAALETRSGNQLSTFSATATGEQKITDLPTKTASQIDPLDNLLGIDAAEGYQTSVQFFTDYVLETQTRTINGQTQTVVASINALGTALTTLTGRVTAAEGAISALDLAKVNRSGDVMTGELTFKSTDLDSTDPPSAGTWGAGVILRDKNDVMVGRLSPHFYANGRVGTHIRAQRVINDTTIINQIGLIIGNDGTLSVNVSDAAAWRSAIGAVNKAGDTMTGDLVLQNKAYYARTTFTRGTPPASDSANGGYIISATNGTSIGRMDAYFFSDGHEGIRVGTARTISGTSYGNYLILSIDSNGDRKVGINGAAPWLTALGLGAATSTTTVANIITANTTNANITSASYAQYGKIAQVNIVYKLKASAGITAVGNMTDLVIGTLVSGKRPKVGSLYISGNASDPYSISYNIATDGTVTLVAADANGSSRTVSTDTYLHCSVMYILA